MILGRLKSIPNVLYQPVLKFSYVNYSQTVKTNPRWIINNLNTLAYSHLNRKEHDKAEKLLTKSLQICMEYTPPKYYLSQRELEVYIEEPTPRSLTCNYILWTLYTLAEIYITQNRSQPALDNLSKIILISSRVFKSNSHEHMDYMNRVGHLYYRLKDFDSAKILFTNVLSVIQRDFPAVYKTYVRHSASANLGLGLIELDQSNIDKAVSLLELSWKQHRIHKGVTNIDTLRTITALAQAYTHQGNYETARTLVEYAGSLYTQSEITEPLPALIALHKQILPHTKNPDKPPILPRATRNGLVKTARFKTEEE